MKASATVHRESFIKLSEKLLRFIEKKPLLPIYGCYLIHFGDKQMHLTASNGSHQASASVDANCKEDVCVCVNARPLHALLLSFPDVEVTFSVSFNKEKKPHRLTVTGGGGKHDFPCYNVDDFVIVAKPKNPTSVIEVDAATFASAISSVSSLVNGKDDTTPQLSGVHITTHEQMPGHIVMEGGTTFRFAVASIREREFYPAKDWRRTIIVKSVAEQVEFIFDCTGTLKVAHSGGNVLITDSMGTEIVTRALEGKFPTMTTLLNSAVKASADRHQVVIPTGSALSALRRLSVHLTETEIDHTCILRMTTEGMTIVYQNRGMATAGEERIRVSGDPTLVDLGIDMDSFRDVLNAIPAEAVEMSYASPDRPTVFVPAGQTPMTFNLTLLCGSSAIN